MKLTSVEVIQRSSKFINKKTVQNINLIIYWYGRTAKEIQMLA